MPIGFDFRGHFACHKMADMLEAKGFLEGLYRLEQQDHFVPNLVGRLGVAAIIAHFVTLRVVKGFPEIV